MAKFKDHNDKDLHVLPDGIVLSTWDRGEKVEPGTDLHVNGAVHHLKHPIDEVAAALGVKADKD